MSKPLAQTVLGQMPPVTSRTQAWQARHRSVQNPTASLWIAGATVFVFSGLLVFDTWRLRNVFGPNDYIQAAVAIYLDLLNMFLAILSLLGGRRN